MKDTAKFVMLCVGVLVLIYGLGFLATGGSLAIYRFWMPQIREAQREVFTESQSFVQGKITYITRLRLQYETTADDNRKEALRRMIITEASDVDRNDLPGELQSFIRRIETR